MVKVLLVDLDKVDPLLMDKAIKNRIRISNVNGFNPRHNKYPVGDVIYTNDESAKVFYKSINITTRPVKSIFEKEVVKTGKCTARESIEFILTTESHFTTAPPSGSPGLTWPRRGGKNPTAFCQVIYVG